MGRRAAGAVSADWRAAVPDLCSTAVFCGLIAVSVAYLRTELTYDEAVYLRLARTIAEGGLPLRRLYEDFGQFRLFANSPPFVLYLASLSQRVLPGDEIPARLVHLAAFAVPTYLLVWRLARVRFGAWAACGSLIALLTTPGYMLAAPHVLLNLPLGLFALVGLLAFDRATGSAAHRDHALAVLAVATSLAVWTKYQAVCFAAALAIYVAVTQASRGYAAIRPMLRALSTVLLSGSLSAAVLVVFFWRFGGAETLGATVAWNASRIVPGPLSLTDAAGEVLETAEECVRGLGGVALLCAACAVWAERRHRGLVLLLASYIAATIAFNLLLFELPGAGTSYLDSAVPSLALLAGTGAVRLVRLATPTVARASLAATVLSIQIAGSASLYEMPRPNASRAAAAYIAEHSPPSAGVMAETVAIEFYSGRPVRPPAFTYPRELVLRSLEGTSGDDISFVIVDRRTMPHRNLDGIRQQWNTLLSTHFEWVHAAGPRVDVYRRRDSAGAGTRGQTPRPHGS